MSQEEKEHFIELWLDDEINQTIMNNYEDKEILAEIRYDLESYGIYDYSELLPNELLIIAKKELVNV